MDKNMLVHFKLDMARCIHLDFFAMFRRFQRIFIDLRRSFGSCCAVSGCSRWP